MEKNNSAVNWAVQPYFVCATEQYYKDVYMRDGIAHFYQYTQDTKDVQNVGNVIAIPDGSIDIISERNEKGIFTHVAGTVLKETILDQSDNSEYFGVRFLPGVLPQILDVSMEELVQQQINLEDIIRSQEVFHKLQQAENFNQWRELFLKNSHKFQEKAFMEHSFSSKKQLAEHIRNQLICSGGQIKVEELAKETQYSTRYINQVFKEYAGVSPKVFGKIVRFQNAIQYINHHPNVALSELAESMGYYDQAHFDKDFKCYAGRSPAEYQKLIQSVDYGKRINVQYRYF